MDLGRKYPGTTLTWFPLVKLRVSCVIDCRNLEGRKTQKSGTLQSNIHSIFVRRMSVYALRHALSRREIPGMTQFVMSPTGPYLYTVDVDQMVRASDDFHTPNKIMIRCTKLRCLFQRCNHPHASFSPFLAFRFGEYLLPQPGPRPRGMAPSVRPAMQMNSISGLTMRREYVRPTSTAEDHRISVRVQSRFACQIQLLPFLS